MKIADTLHQQGMSRIVKIDAGKTGRRMCLDIFCGKIREDATASLKHSFEIESGSVTCWLCLGHPTSANMSNHVLTD